MMEKERVCVTGGGGYQASWLIRLLLSKGYMVHATVRDPNDEKNAHLLTLENASENLRLFKTELLDYDGLSAAVQGCCGVFHVASPVAISNVPNPEKEIVEPAVTGTSYILKASSIAKVKRVVVVSSIAAVMFNSNWPKDQLMDESCWSDKELWEDTNQWGLNWYCLSKTLAESHALEYGKKFGLDVVTVCPSIIIGPMLQPKMNPSGLYIHLIMTGGFESLENKIRMFVDVRDMAEALLLVYEKPEAEGRYICSSCTITMQDLVDKLKSIYPNYNYPKRIFGIDEDWDLTSGKLQKLGWKYRPLEETVVDSFKNYQEKGILK